MKNLLLIFCASLFSCSLAQGWIARVQNLNVAENAAYSLFTDLGELLPGTLANNIRVGTFADGFDIAAAWNAGDITALDTAFSLASLRGMIDFDDGYNGIFQFEVSSSVTDFYGKHIALWISDSTNFTRSGGLHLIYVFNQEFPSSPTAITESILGESPGQLLVGGFGNYAYDYGAVGPVLAGYNLVQVVPEPSAMAVVMAVTLMPLLYGRIRNNMRQWRCAI